MRKDLKIWSAGLLMLSLLSGGCVEKAVPIPPEEQKQKNPDVPPKKAPPPLKVDPNEKAQPATKPASKPVSKAQKLLIKELADHGVHLVLEKKFLWVAGRVCVLDSNLEYVLVGNRGAKHESLLMADLKPSMLNAGLLALGLKKGRNFYLEEKIPPPSEEEVLSGKTKPYILHHPKGSELYLTVEWAGKGDKKIRHRVEELILDLDTKKALEPRKWVYFGGRMASLYKGEPPVFIADFEMNLVSVCYMTPDNHLITIKHEHGLNQGNWWANNKLLPPQGTPIRIYFSLDPL